MKIVLFKAIKRFIWFIERCVGEWVDCIIPVLLAIASLCALWVGVAGLLRAIHVIK